VPLSKSLAWCAFTQIEASRLRNNTTKKQPHLTTLLHHSPTPNHTPNLTILLQKPENLRSAPPPLEVMSDGKTSYRAALRALDLKAFGCIHGGKKDAQPDVSVKLSCHRGDLGPYLEVKLTVAAPTSMHLPDNKQSTFSTLYTQSLVNCEHDLVTQDNIEEVPKEIRETHRFDETALAYHEGKPGVVKHTITYKNDSTHEGLFNTLSFKGYIDPETDEPLGDKPHAFDSLRNVFSQDGDITFYVRNEETGFQSEFDRLREAMEVEHKEGTVIDHFYQSSATTTAGGGEGNGVGETCCEAGCEGGEGK